MTRTDGLGNAIDGDGLDVAEGSTAGWGASRNIARERTFSVRLHSESVITPFVEAHSVPSEEVDPPTTPITDVTPPSRTLRLVGGI